MIYNNESVSLSRPVRNLALTGPHKCPVEPRAVGVKLDPVTVLL